MVEWLLKLVGKSSKPNLAPAIEDRHHVPVNLEPRGKASLLVWRRCNPLVSIMDMAQQLVLSRLIVSLRGRISQKLVLQDLPRSSSKVRIGSVPNAYLMLKMLAIPMHEPPLPTEPEVVDRTLFKNASRDPRVSSCRTPPVGERADQNSICRRIQISHTNFVPDCWICGASPPSVSWRADEVEFQLIMKLDSWDPNAKNKFPEHLRTPLARAGIAAYHHDLFGEREEAKGFFTALTSALPYNQFTLTVSRSFEAVRRS